MTVLFLIVCVFGMTLGHRVGWFLSRSFLYSSSWLVCALVSVVWGLGIAFGLHQLILATNPALIARFFGYGAGAYIAIPNFGLLNEGSIPDGVMARHVFIKAIPWVLFIAASFLFALRPELISF